MKNGGTNIWVGAEIRQVSGVEIWIPLIKITSPDTDKEITFMADVHFDNQEECRLFSMSLMNLIGTKPSSMAYSRDGGLSGKR